MNVIIDGTGNGTYRRRLESVPRLGDTVLVDGEFYDVIDVMWDLDENEALLEVSEKTYD